MLQHLLAYGDERMAPPRRGGQLTPDELSAAYRLWDVLAGLRLLRTGLPLHLVETFLRVALDEGRSVSHYASQMGVAVTVMSRHLLELGSHERIKGPGLGLVIAKQSPEDLKRYEVYLTDKGRHLVQEIARKLSAKQAFPGA
jgi:DNA-binding MarR family transcriptional regulator